jgi:hypothetical protein
MPDEDPIDAPEDTPVLVAPLSEDVRALLTELLMEFKISARHPQFDSAAALIGKARDELAAQQ